MDWSLPEHKHLLRYSAKANAAWHAARLRRSVLLPVLADNRRFMIEGNWRLRRSLRAAR